MHAHTHARTHARTHTHTRLTAICLGLPGCASTTKAKPIWILLKQETVSGSGISWAICKSAPRSRQITTPAPHLSVFLQAGCPSYRPTNSVEALNMNKTKVMISGERQMVRQKDVRWPCGVCSKGVGSNTV